MHKTGPSQGMPFSRAQSREEAQAKGLAEPPPRIHIQIAPLRPALELGSAVQGAYLLVRNGSRLAMK